MHRAILSFFFCLLAGTALRAQITITASDMPVSGDTLRYSLANPVTAGINLNDTGTSKTWNFSNLTPISQGVDTFKSAAQVNATYAFTISPTAYGIKVADSLPGAPISVQQIYNFFNKKTSPSRYVTEGFAAKVAGTPIPINYSDEDEVYLFPLTYPHGQDSTTFKLTFSFAGLGSFSQQGYRKTRVDGWGTIMTPFTASPVQAIRVRSEIVEIDSFAVTGSAAQGIARTTVEYKWLANGQHYPMLIVTTTKLGGTETPTSARYRDTKRDFVGVSAPSAAIKELQVYPNPAVGTALTVKVPASWVSYTLYVYDAAGKRISSTLNTTFINTAALPAGHYTVVVDAGREMGVAQFVK